MEGGGEVLADALLFDELGNHFVRAKGTAEQPALKNMSTGATQK